MRLRFNRHKIFSTVLNIIGLTLAFSVFLILTVQVVYDTRYDLGYPDTDKVVRIEYSDPTSPGVYGVQLSRPIIEQLKGYFPQVEAVACYQYYKNNSGNFKEADTDIPGVRVRYATTDFDLLRVFPFEFVEGDTSGYRAPGTAVISERGARKVFGDQSPVGKDIQFETKDNTGYSWRIVAVYKDFPDNSSMDNELLLNIGDESLNNPSEWSFPCYMKLRTGEGMQPLLDSLNYMFYGDGEYADNADVRLSTLHDAYYARGQPHHHDDPADRLDTRAADSHHQLRQLRDGLRAFQHQEHQHPPRHRLDPRTADPGAALEGSRARAAGLHTEYRSDVAGSHILICPLHLRLSDGV